MSMPLAEQIEGGGWRFSPLTFFTGTRLRLVVVVAVVVVVVVVSPCCFFQ